MAEGRNVLEWRRRRKIAIDSVDYDLVQPFAERHAGASRKILGHFTRLGIYAFHAPGSGRCHENPLPATIKNQSDTLYIGR